MASTDAESAGLAESLAQDLGLVLGQPVSAADLLPRRDGAMAPVIGVLALAEAKRSKVASRLVAEWARTEGVRDDQPEELAAPAAFELTTLSVNGTSRPLVHGIRLCPVAAAVPAEALSRLAMTIIALVGGVPEVVLIEPGRGTERAPGWVARLRLLVRLDELGAAPEPGGDVGAWICETQANVSSIYIPDAHPDSLWQAQLTGVRAAALAALKAIGQEPPPHLDLHRRQAPGFWEAMDRQRCVEFREQPGTGSVLQIAMLPRRLGDRIIPGYALLAPET